MEREYISRTLEKTEHYEASLIPYVLCDPETNIRESDVHWQLCIDFHTKDSKSKDSFFLVDNLLIGKNRTYQEAHDLWIYLSRAITGWKPTEEEDADA